MPAAAFLAVAGVAAGVAGDGGEALRSPAVAGVTGKYFKNCRPADSSKESQDASIRRKLWEISSKLVGLEAGAAA